ATLSALGLSVIVVRSAVAYEVLKGLGACYLIGLGLWTIVQALRQPPHHPVSAEQLPRVPRARQRWWQAWSEGLLNNVLNPKPAIFYLAFLPQFIHPTDPVLLKSLLLAGVHFVIGVLWLTLLVLVLGRIGAWVTHPRVRQQLETITGVVLIGLGLRLALEPRA
ncbi:MAG: LysE family translocator, partial [Chloroflexales bacterium]|nr:LysE family translocator [Chloroflexales bacterium]